MRSLLEEKTVCWMGVRSLGVVFAGDCFGGFGGSAAHFFWRMGNVVVVEIGLVGVRCESHGEVFFGAGWLLHVGGVEVRKEMQ